LPDRAGDDRCAGEQAALRRVATLVARAAPSGEVFTAITEEAGRLLGADYATMHRYTSDGTITVAATWSSTGPVLPIGTRARLGGRNMQAMIFRTRAPARMDDYDDASGPIAVAVREFGVRAAVGVPVSVEGRLWGLLVVTSRAGPLPAGAEVRLAGFTELAATAIANAEARVKLRGFAEEQAALRRVATLVARGSPPAEVFSAVAEEAARFLSADHTMMARYDPDDTMWIAAIWDSADPALPVGAQAKLGGRNVPTLVFQTGRPARMDNYTGASGPVADAVRELGIRAAVGVPVDVEGRLWGLMTVASRAGPLPAGTEAQLAGFTELVATAIANAQARVELGSFAEEQAALRRVATLVAGAAPPQQVFAAVTEETGRLLHADLARMGRYGPDGTRTIVAAWDRAGIAIPSRTQAKLGGRTMSTMVFQTGRPARIDDYASASGSIAAAAREIGLRASVGVPVRVEGRLWGVVEVGSRAEPLSAGAEGQLSRFTELVGTAIANAEAQAALNASRARIVATADATRRRIERNLHDGAQQRLVSLALDLRAAQAASPPGTGKQFDRLATAVDGVLEELREIARGLHPAILADGGLRPALKTLARRSAVPVHLDIRVDRRLPDLVEIAAYYTVSEALTNAAKHARATTAHIEVTPGDGVLHLRVRDDGRGGADFSQGTGLLGLRDRAEALGGLLRLHSPPGAGTTLEVTLPLGEHGGPELPGAVSLSDDAGPPDASPGSDWH
jgi:signal transduction histidine kinase